MTIYSCPPLCPLDFYVQIFARTHGVPNSVGFYTVRRCSGFSCKPLNYILATTQLAILNASSMFGRIIPNMLAPKYGVFNLLIFSGAACAVVIFALFGISTTAGIVIFAILSGFMSGACACIFATERLNLLTQYASRPLSHRSGHHLARPQPSRDRVRCLRCSHAFIQN